MEESILDSIKTRLGLALDEHVFDSDLISHINGVFMVLMQLGVGPQDQQFVVEDDTTTWVEFTTTKMSLYGVRTYMYLEVRQLFDPPTSSFGLTAIKEQASKMEWRLNFQSEFEGLPVPPPPELFP